MAEYKIGCLLWNNTDNHDKIWGWVTFPGGNMFCFWGRRSVVDSNGMTSDGKRPSLSFKKHTNVYELNNLANDKKRKGYNNVPVDTINKVVPGFSEFFEYALVTARMTGKVKSDDWN